MTLRWQAAEAIMARVALPVPCIPMRTIEALESNIRRDSHGDSVAVGMGVELAAYCRLRCVVVGMGGVGNEVRPSLTRPSAFIIEYERFIPDAM
jgi:hypothetical protein